MATDKELIQKARQTDMLSYLEGQNQRALAEGKVPPFEITPEGNQYRLNDHGGLLFTRNMWNQRSTQIGGNTLDFVMKIEGKSFKEAIEILTSERDVKSLQRVSPAALNNKPKIPFELPEKNETFRRAIAYLTKTRGLDANLVLDEIKKGRIYEDKEYHNVVFVGWNEKDEPVWAQKRSTLSDRKFVMDQVGSDSRYPYYYGNPGARTVVVVESPIEALSLVNLMKIENKDISNVCFLSLGGVHDTALRQFLHDHPTCKGIVTALNNDRAEKPNEIKGHEGSEHIKNTYGKQYSVGSIFPKSNDWNDDLRAVRERINQQKSELQKDHKDVESQIKEYARQKQKQRLQEQKGPTRVRAR